MKSIHNPMLDICTNSVSGITDNGIAININQMHDNYNDDYATIMITTYIPLVKSEIKKATKVDTVTGNITVSNDSPQLYVKYLIGIENELNKVLDYSKYGVNKPSILYIPHLDRCGVSLAFSIGTYSDYMRFKRYLCHFMNAMHAIIHNSIEHYDLSKTKHYNDPSFTGLLIPFVSKFPDVGVSNIEASKFKPSIATVTINITKTRTVSDYIKNTKVTPIGIKALESALNLIKVVSPSVTSDWDKNDKKVAQLGSITSTVISENGNSPVTGATMGKLFSVSGLDKNNKRLMLHLLLHMHRVNKHIATIAKEKLREYDLSASKITLTVMNVIHSIIHGMGSNILFNIMTKTSNNTMIITCGVPAMFDKSSSRYKITEAEEIIIQEILTKIMDSISYEDILVSIYEESNHNAYLRSLLNTTVLPLNILRAIRHINPTITLTDVVNEIVNLSMPLHECSIDKIINKSLTYIGTSVGVIR